MGAVNEGMVAPVGIRARLLGPFEIEGVDLTEVRSRKARTLLKVLAIAAGRPVSVDRLVDCLWGDTPPAKAEREVAVNASRARSVVGAEAVERSDAGYRLHVAWTDLEALGALEVEAQKRADAGDFVGARAAAEAGLALVRGPFLCDEADPWWAEAERVGADRRIAGLRRLSARVALSLGALGPACSEAEQLLATDPLDEEALRILMGAQAAAGRAGSALGAYADVRLRLADELGVDPDPETEALHLAILQGRPLPGVPHRPTAAVPIGDPAPDGSTPPGREAQIGALLEGLAGAGLYPLVLSLDGEPGAGKTTILDAFARLAEARGAVVLRATCDTVDLPLEPIGAALADHLRMLGISERHAVLGEEAEVLAPLVGGSGAPVPALPGPVATSDALVAMLHSALSRVLGRLTEGGPVIMLLDDAHLAGESTRAWLRHIRRRRAPAVLVVAAQRTGGGEIEADRAIPVGPLDIETVTRIAGPERAGELHERSGGNALFLVELASAPPGQELPASVRAAVLRRLSETGPTASSSLRTSAVLGEEVDVDLLAGVLRRSPLDVLDDLELGLAHGLLTERAGRLVFRHDLVRDALAAGVSVARQTLIHREACRILGDRPDADPLVMAHHARKAGDPRSAARALAEAARLAAFRFDLAEAERLLDDALALTEDGDLFVQRGRARLARGDLDGAEADAVAAVAGGGATALELRAWVARFRHDMETAIRIGNEAADRATDPTTRASALVAVGSAHRGLGDLAAAERELTAAVAMEGSAVLGTRGWLGGLRVHQGRPFEALDLLEPEIGAEVETIHGFWVEHTLRMTAHACAMTGRVMEALGLLDRLARELERRGSSVRYAGMVENYQGWIRRNLADPAGLVQAERSLDMTALPEVHVQSMLDLADGLLRTGDTESAAARLDAAEQAMGVRWFHNRWRCQARLGLLRAHLSLAEHDLAAAERAYAVREAAEERGDRRYVLLARLAEARAAGIAGAAVDLDAVATDLSRLGDVAALESWWTTALVARDLGVDRWRRTAEVYVERLAGGLGPEGRAFRERAGRWLDRC